MAQLAVTLGLNATSKTDSSFEELSGEAKVKLNALAIRADEAFDVAKVEHVDALRLLWLLSFEKDTKLPHDLKSDMWKDMGWQGTSPATDFRAGGLLSLENLIWLAQRKPKLYQALRYKTRGARSEFEYPFAVAGVTLTYNLVKMLDIKEPKPTTRAAACFARINSEVEDAFEFIYATAFASLDANWLDLGSATYMDFPKVMKETLSELAKAMEDSQSLDDIATRLGVVLVVE